jgi:hypothetical protein
MKNAYKIMVGILKSVGLLFLAIFIILFNKNGSSSKA